MGCDGGTIPKRKEVVKSKQKSDSRDKELDRSAKWQFCQLSGLRLKKPIVACYLGRLYNKEAVIEHLLSLKTQVTKSNKTVKHIKSMKDVKELKLKERNQSDSIQASSSGTSSRERSEAEFICPISGLEMTGKYKFYFFAGCGCVVSERALKEVPDDKHCILCSKAYNPELDIIVINGDHDETRKLEEILSGRRKDGAKKHKPSADCSNTNRNPMPIDQSTSSHSTKRQSSPTHSGVTTSKRNRLQETVR